MIFYLFYYLQSLIKLSISNSTIMQKQTLLTSQALKQKAKHYFINNDFIQALAYYQKALSLQSNHQKRSIILTNISLCYCNLNLPKSYLQSVLKALQQNPKYLKGQYHHIRALSSLGQLQKAEKLLKQYAIEYTQKQVLQSLINKIKISHEKGFQYSQNWANAFKTGKLDFQFISDDIQIRKSPYGLGIFAKNNVSAFKIVIAEKPLVFVTKKEEYKMGESDETLMLKKIEKLSSISDEFNERFKTIAPKRLINLNLQERKKRPNVTKQQIIEAIRLNWFQTPQFTNFMNGKQDTPDDSGLYQKISFLNHSCERNCQYLFIGEWMIVRTIAQIKKNEQLFINYFYENQRAVRQERLKRLWDISCDCILCRQQRKQDEGKLDPDPFKFKSQQMKRHYFTSQIFFRGFDAASKYYILQNPQMRWKYILNYHNQNQLKVKMISKMFKCQKQQTELQKIFKYNEKEQDPAMKMIRTFQKLNIP